MRPVLGRQAALRDGTSATPGALYALTARQSENWPQAFAAWSGCKSGPLALLDVWGARSPQALTQQLLQAGLAPEGWVLLRAAGPLQAEQIGSAWLRQSGTGAHLLVLGAEDLALHTGAQARFAAPDWLRLARRHGGCVWGILGAPEALWGAQNHAFAAWSGPIGN